MTTNPPTIPADYVPSRWVSVFTRNELRYLAERQDATIKTQRQTIIQLRAMLDKEGSNNG